MAEIYIDCDGTYFDTYREQLGPAYKKAIRAPKPGDHPGKPTVKRDELPFNTHFLSAMKNRKEFIPNGFPFTACLGGTKRIRDADIRPGIDCLIDDNLDACREMVRLGGMAYLILQPWHLSTDEHWSENISRDIVVVPNLREAILKAEHYMFGGDFKHRSR